jgi:hypothetical protein
VNRSLLLIGTYCISLVGAGHGIVPVLYLLIEGSLQAWGIAMIPGWLGIIGTIAYHAYCEKQMPATFLLVTRSLLYLSWLAFASVVDHSYSGSYVEHILGMAVISFPFQVAFIWLVGLPVIRLRNK